MKAAEADWTRTVANSKINNRLAVAKTTKMYINGSFVRPESGRTKIITFTTPNGTKEIRVPIASRKDVRDAVRASTEAAASWSQRDPYNRGQIIFRIAEMLEEHSSRFLEYGVSEDEFEDAVDSLVSAAGWSDKINAVVGEVSSVPGGLMAAAECVGVGTTGLIDEDCSFVRLCRSIGAALACGNSLVALVSGPQVGALLFLGETLAVSDVPSGLVNLLTAFDDQALRTIVEATAVRGVRIVGDNIDLVGAAAFHLCRLAPSVSHLGSIGIDELRWQVDIRTVWGVAGV